MSKINIGNIEGNGNVVGDNNAITNNLNIREKTYGEGVDLTKEILKFLIENNNSKFVDIAPYLRVIVPHDDKAILATLKRLLHKTGLQHDNLIDENHTYYEWHQLGNPHKNITIHNTRIQLRITLNGINFYNQNYREAGSDKSETENKDRKENLNKDILASNSKGKIIRSHMEFEYDITLSFAGENRDYVDAVAQILKENGIKVFYDRFEEVDLWGKDLGIHFDYVYRKGARYCAIFISKFYKEKIWTNHEIRTAIARSIESNMEYILPARFDDTEIDGIRPTIGYIDLRTVTPETLAHLIIKKLEKEPKTPLPERVQKAESRIHLAVKALISEYQGKVGCLMGVNIVNSIKEPRYFNEPSFKLSKAFKNGGDSFYLMEKFQNVNFPIKLEYGEPCDVNYKIVPKSLEMWKSLDSDTKVQAIITTTLGERFQSNEVPITDILLAFGLK